MKKQLLSLCFIVASLVARNDSDDFTPKIDVTSVHTVSNREQILKIPIYSNTGWLLTKESYRWCVPDKSHGTGNARLSYVLRKTLIARSESFRLG